MLSRMNRTGHVLRWILLPLILLAGTIAPTTATATDIFTVYLAPDGSDANDGLDADSPVNTIARVQEILVAHDPTTDVEVRIEQGYYYAPPMHTWRFYIPGHTISFLPIDYEYGEGIDGIAGLPTFVNQQNADGTYPSGYWLQPRLPTDQADPLYDGGTSGLRFYYLRVVRYSAGGVSVYGDSERDVDDETYDPPLQVQGSAGLNGNTFFGMQFQRLGSQWATGASYGYGAIVLTNSSNNRIVNNHFDNIENASPNGGYIHGLYITHYSSNNDIERNSFAYNSGDPVKFRNMSNYNEVYENTFVRTGTHSFYRGEFCDLQCAIDNDIPRQCASYHNRFFYNSLQSGYAGGAIPTWSLDPPGLTHAGEAPCSIPEGDARLYTGYNTT